MPIVTLNVSQTQAPTPPTLQQSGAIVSQGATTQAVGTYTYLYGTTGLTAILAGAEGITSMVWASSVVTVTASAPHGFTIGDTISLTISGVVPTGYNGTYNCTITTTTAFTFPLGANPGSVTTQGVYTVEDVNELNLAVQGFFAQGKNVGVYVLELGAGNPNDGITALTSFLTVTGVQKFYSYLLPRNWGGSSYATAVATFLNGYTALTAKTYFHITATSSTYSTFSNLLKCAIVTVEAPAVYSAWVAGAGTEISAVAGFCETLSNNPSSAGMVTPSAFSDLFDVTPFPTFQNAAVLATYKAANINVVGTGAEGGYSNTIWLYGTTMDGNDFSYWFSVDWVQINSDLNISNAIINGSNNPLAPLYYSQQGINTLQANQVSTMKQAVSYGLALGQVVTTQLTAVAFAAAVAAGTYSGQVVVNAVPFSSYVALNPGNYPLGIYGGLQVAYTPNRGFKQIIINVNVNNFVTQ